MYRFIIAKLSDTGRHYAVSHDFVGEEWEAMNAFRLLYKGCNGYVLFKQQAVIDSEPAGSCNEADDSTRADSLFESQQQLARSAGL